MENASKALIIAGSILLAILIIGLAIFIYGQAANSMGNLGLDQYTIRQFNSQFEPYEGTQTGAQVKQLIKLVNSSNFTYADDESMKVEIEYKEGASATNIGSGKMYSVSFPDVETTGIIKKIRILPKDSIKF